MPQAENVPQLMNGLLRGPLPKETHVVGQPVIDLPKAGERNDSSAVCPVCQPEYEIKVRHVQVQIGDSESTGTAAWIHVIQDCIGKILSALRIPGERRMRQRPAGAARHGESPRQVHSKPIAHLSRHSTCGDKQYYVPRHSCSLRRCWSANGPTGLAADLSAHYPFPGVESCRSSSELDLESRELDLKTREFFRFCQQTPVLPETHRI